MAAVGDIHIGHRRNPAREIVHNLYRAFPDNAATAALDIIFFEGDFFDDLLTAPNEAFDEADPFLAHMLRLSAKHGIVLRFLEGTPSHDWRQMERIVTLERMLQTGADVKYVKELSIEYIEKHDIHVLYVPDEWETSAERTLEQVDALLRAKGLTQVDYAVMHGQFEYQLPDFVKAQKHSSTEYLKRVKKLIFIGHVHVHSRLDRIIAAGSFDRLVHGEEGPKGHVRARVCGDEMYVQFVENEHAKRFVTLNCVGLTLEDTLLRVTEGVRGLPDGSFVRVEADQTNPILTNMELLIRNHPTMTWSKLVREEAEQEQLTDAQSEEVLYVPITLTRDNLGALLIERIAARHTPSAEVLGAAEEILKEVL